MRQERIRKTPRRRTVRVDPPAAKTLPRAPRPSYDDDLLDRIDQLLETV